MKIIGGHLQRIHEAYGARRKSQPSETAGTKKAASSSDSVELSESAQEVRRLTAALDQVPEARRKRVEEIQEAVEAGSYQINPRQVAQHMLETGAVDEEF